MRESINTVVIGAGVIGLACGRALAQAGREVIVVERNEGIGQETSSRNSEVIHAGIYYPTGSLKARLCVAGKQALYDYCQDRNVPHKRIGKLIVATRAEDQVRLEQLRERASANGVGDLQMLSADEIRALEPDVSASAGVLSPSTGIVDAHAFMLALHADLEAAGGHVALRSELKAAAAGRDYLDLDIDSGGEITQLRAANVINCAGLHASAVAEILRGNRSGIPGTRYARGVYFEYAGASPFSRLIYPMPEPGGLGVHATLDMSGALRFGPDVEWIDTLDYSVDPARGAGFADAIARWWPGLEPDRLKPGYAGIRPKLAEPGAEAADFSITAERSGGRAIVDLLGIESPGLTSALAIGAYVRDLLR